MMQLQGASRDHLIHFPLSK